MEEAEVVIMALCNHGIPAIERAEYHRSYATDSFCRTYSLTSARVVKCCSRYVQYYLEGSPGGKRISSF